MYLSDGYIMSVEVKGGCLSVIDMCTTVIQLLLIITDHVPSVAVLVIPYSLLIPQMSKDMRHSGRWFHSLLTACSVKRLTRNLSEYACIHLHMPMVPNSEVEILNVAM